MAVYAHVCLECTFQCHTCKKAQSQTLFDASCFPPSLLPERGHAPALSCQDVVQLLLQSFDTRDEVNMVDNQCKHPLYHGLVCDSVSSAANPLLDAGSTWDQLR